MERGKGSRSFAIAEGPARICGDSGIMLGFTIMEDRLADSIRVEDEAERLVALQALETFRALREAVKTAPHGKGLATVEAVVRDKGFDHLSKMYQSAVREHPEAQKKGPAV